MAHLSSEHKLLFLKEINHRANAFQRLQHHPVLYALLHYGLNAAVGLSHHTREFPHPIDIYAAE